jgi:hypothetical protein
MMAKIATAAISKYFFIGFTLLIFIFAGTAAFGIAWGASSAPRKIPARAVTLR